MVWTPRNTQSVNLEIFPKIWQSISNGFMTIGNGISNWWNGLDSQTQTAVIVVGAVVVVCIVLAPFTGGLSLGGLIFV